MKKYIINLKCCLNHRDLMYFDNYVGADMDRKLSMSLESHSLTEASHSGSYNRGMGLAGSLAGNGSGTPIDMGSSPPCSSFTEIQADKQSVTRLGNPPGMIASGRARLGENSCGRGELRLNPRYPTYHHHLLLNGLLLLCNPLILSSFHRVDHEQFHA